MGIGDVDGAADSGDKLIGDAAVLSGSQPISGSWASGGQSEVRVWGLDTLELQHTLLQPGGADVWALVAVQGCVWEECGGVGGMWWCGDAVHEAEGVVFQRLHGGSLQ